MRQLTTTLNITSRHRGLHDITPQIKNWVASASISTGLLTVYMQHTSASLIINENYDRDVIFDLERFIAKLVVDGDPLFEHTIEGPDDMPAHVRTALTQTSLSIPVLASQIALGQWQGIFLWEHRLASSIRKIILHIIGE